LPLAQECWSLTGGWAAALQERGLLAEAGEPGYYRLSPVLAGALAGHGSPGDIDPFREQVAAGSRTTRGSRKPLSATRRKPGRGANVPRPARVDQMSQQCRLADTRLSPHHEDGALAVSHVCYELPHLSLMSHRLSGVTA
jgi:hypothetical protein